MDLLGSLREALSRDCYRLDRGEVEDLVGRFSVDTETLLRALVDFGKGRARADISQFYVGTAGLTESGEIFMGVNLEYGEASFAQTVHAEQFLASWTRACSASPLIAIAVSAPPCGHCRQFLREADPAGEIRLLIGTEPGVKASELLPRAFTPLDLGVEEPFLSGPLVLEGADLEEAARRAAEHSYTPYSKMKAGVAVRLDDGRIFAGAALENAAYNPTLPPLQAALVACHANSAPVDQIREVVLCEGRSPIRYEGQTRVLAQALGVPSDSLRVISA